MLATVFIMEIQKYKAKIKGTDKEFDYPLDKVQRKWLRRTATLLLSPILIIAGALFGAFEMGKQWFDECW